MDSLDEALKALGHPAMLSKVLGGSFADQKICQGCPHRYVFSYLTGHCILLYKICALLVISMLNYLKTGDIQIFHTVALIK